MAAKVYIMSKRKSTPESEQKDNISNKTDDLDGLKALDEGLNIDVDAMDKYDDDVEADESKADNGIAKGVSSITSKVDDYFVRERLGWHDRLLTRLRFKTAGRLPTRRAEDASERIPYLAFLILGFFGILLGKIFTPIPARYFAYVAAVAIIVYGLVWGLRSHNRVRIDRIGDNCYYLGLTYTLASLISALNGLSGDEIGQTLLQDFGIALASTAAGVIMRMFLIQFRNEIDDIETDARLALSNEVTMFETSLRKSRADLDDYRSTVQKSISDTHIELANALKAHAKKLSDQSFASANSLDERMAAVDQFLTIFEKQSESLFQIANTLGNATTDLAKRMDGINAQPDTLENAFASIGAGLQQSEAAIVSTAGKLEQTSDAISAHSKGSDEFLQMTAALEARLSTIDNFLGRMTSNFEKQGEAIETSTKVMREHVSAMKSYTDAAELEGRRMQDATKSVYESLGSLANVIVKAARRGF